MTLRKKYFRNYPPYDWSDLISISEAAELYGRNERTLRANIKNGLFIADVDCKKIGNMWVFDRRALDLIYGKPIPRPSELDMIDFLQEGDVEVEEDINAID